MFAERVVLVWTAGDRLRWDIIARQVDKPSSCFYGDFALSFLFTRIFMKPNPLYRRLKVFEYCISR